MKAEVKKALFTEKSTAQLLDQLRMKKAGSRIDANFPETIVEKGAKYLLLIFSRYSRNCISRVLWKNRFLHFRCPDLRKWGGIISLFQGFVTVLIG
ncbi:hypothetical protein [Peribacillus sp. NPDC056705]|uniref:hypothetical protein n=1 Tax=Peribacillus sp. NPDC056705 TaxID=3345918 RepID=UPI003749782B